MFDALMDSLFGPLLEIPPLWAILIASLMISVLSTVAYKFLTNQELMKSLKADLKKHQNDMKAHKDNPDKMMAIQKKAMDANMKYMGQSMRPTLLTLPIILLIFPWLGSHFAYSPLMPDTPFEATVFFNSAVTGEVALSSVPNQLIINNQMVQIEGSNASFTMNGPAGKYEMDFEYTGIKYTIPIIISEQQKSLTPEKKFKNSVVQKITINQSKLQPMGDLSIFGWKPKWLGTYIIFSIIFSMGLRKAMGLS